MQVYKLYKLAGHSGVVLICLVPYRRYIVFFRGGVPAMFLEILYGVPVAGMCCPWDACAADRCPRPAQIKYDIAKPITFFSIEGRQVLRGTGGEYIY